MTKATEESVKHFVIVFLYSGVSSVLPIVMAWIEKDPRWTLLIPVINALWYAVTRYLKERKLITNGMR